MNVNARVVALELAVDQLTRKLTDLESRLASAQTDPNPVEVASPVNVTVHVPPGNDDGNPVAEALIRREMAEQWIRSRGRY